jgi:ketosteroid isomerase-like protein
MGEYSVVKDFISRLQEAEKTRDAKGLCELFAADAELENLTRPTGSTRSSKSKTNNAKAFWNQYLVGFEEVSSDFTSVIEANRTAVLEWHSLGRLAMGTPIEYSGVSIFEHDGRRITAFRTYYDSAALLPHAAHAAKPFSESVGTPEIRTDASS